MAQRIPFSCIIRGRWDRLDDRGRGRPKWNTRRAFGKPTDSRIVRPVNVWLCNVRYTSTPRLRSRGPSRAIPIPEGADEPAQARPATESCQQLNKLISCNHEVHPCRVQSNSQRTSSLYFQIQSVEAHVEAPIDLESSRVICQATSEDGCTTNNCSSIFTGILPYALGWTSMRYVYDGKSFRGPYSFSSARGESEFPSRHTLVKVKYT